MEEYAVLHICKAKGNDTAMSAHIERTVSPANADPSRTHLNRELIAFPEGVGSRSEAVRHRIDTAGLSRRVARGQVRALRLVLSASRLSMARIEREGRLGEWTDVCVDWLSRTFGRENVVSAVLHMDETKPHIHATIVPIVTRNRLLPEPQDAPTPFLGDDSPRLCASQVVTRGNMRLFQSSYAEAVSCFGLRRGVEGSTVRSHTTFEFYRSLLEKDNAMTARLEELERRIASARAAQASMDVRVRRDRMRSAVTDAVSGAAQSVASLIGTPEVRTLREENGALRSRLESMCVHQAELVGRLGSRDRTVAALREELAGLEKARGRELREVSERLDRLRCEEVSRLREGMRRTAEAYPDAGRFMDAYSVLTSFGVDSDTASHVALSGGPERFSGMLRSPDSGAEREAEDAVLSVRTCGGASAVLVDGLPPAEWIGAVSRGRGRER